MKENKEDWSKQLDTVLIEVSGMNEVLICRNTSKFLQLIFKLEGLKVVEDLNFESYRKTIFEAITLL